MYNTVYQPGHLIMLDNMAYMMIYTQ